MEEFIINNRLDDKAAKILRESDPEVQEEVLAQGNIEGGVTNPSSLVMGRIGKARKALSVSTQFPEQKKKICNSDS